MLNNFLATPSTIAGNPASKVRLLIYEDLQCGDCARLHRIVTERLLPEHGARLAVEHHDFPLPKHDWARPAAIAARHFGETNPTAAPAFRDELLSNLSQITAANLETWIRAFARRAGLDESEAAASLTNVRFGAQVDHDRQSGLDRGVHRTPTAFLGPIAFIERFPYEDLSLMIRSALEREAE